VSALLRSEWIKFRSVRSTWVMVGLAIALSYLIAGIAANSFEGRHPADTISAGSVIVLVLLLVLGIQFVAQEYRFGTIRVAFTAVPQRRRLLLAKTAFGAGVGLVTALIAVGGSYAVASIVLNGDGRSIPVDARLAETIAGFVLVAGVSVVVGIAIGCITRNPALGITAALIDMFVLESLVTVFVSEDVGSVLPFSTAFAAVPGNSGSTLVSPWSLALVVYAAWAVGLLVVGTVLVERRDP
jgi:ABC-2 type transport system permease protein